MLETDRRSGYFGVFADIYASANVESMGGYEGPFAILSDKTLHEFSDVEDYIELAAHQGGSILELGCGSGRVLLQLAQRGYNVTGLEISKDMIALLRERLHSLPKMVQERVRVEQKDARNFDLGIKFSLIILPCATLPLIPTFEDRKAVLRNAVSHLEAGGRVAFSYLKFNAISLNRLDKGGLETVPFECNGQLARACVGTRVRREDKCILFNAFIEMPKQNGEMGRFLASSIVNIIDQEELDRLLKETHLEVEARKRADFKGFGELETLICTRDFFEEHPLWHPYQSSHQLNEQRLLLVEGKGCRVWDKEGRSYIDASGGLWNVQCGLGDPTIIEGITEQLKRLSYATLFANRSNEPAMELARKLVSIAPAPLPCVYLTNSGSESVELSIKLCRMYNSLGGKPHKREIVYLDQSYHGTFFGSMSVSGLFDNRYLFSPTLPGVHSISTPDPGQCPPETSFKDYVLKCADELEERIFSSNGGVAAFLMEPVIGSAGFIVPPKEYFARIQEICKKHKVLLVVDEVATGFGRTGRWFACEHFDLRPDILLLSKGINSGYLPLGAVLFSQDIGQRLIDSKADIGHGSTQNGNPACAVSGIMNIDVIKRDRLVEKAAANGEYFRSRLEELVSNVNVQEVRGLGLMLAIVLKQSDGSEATREQVEGLLMVLQRCGVLCYPNRSSLVFVPPLVLSREEIDVITNILHKVLKNMRLENRRVVQAKK